MIQKQIEVRIKNGLHARPAGELVKLLKPFKSNVNLIKGGKKFNMKSIIHIMSTSIKERDIVHFEVDGEDENEVISKLETFFR
jgi:phosphotransferase system HPr (HPr) family protein